MNAIGENGIFFSNGKLFVFQGAYYDKLQKSLSTPEECARQTNTLDSEEVCIMLSDPVLIVIANSDRGALAFRTTLPATRGQEFVNFLNPAGVKILDSGKICLAKLRPRNARL